MKTISWLPGLALGLVVASCSCDSDEPSRTAFECANDTECGTGTCTDSGQCTCPNGTDEDCPSGSYCASNLCWQDCTNTGGECREGQICTSDGRCIADPNGTDSAKPNGDSSTMGENCPGILVDLANQTPTVMLLIDRSGSMRTDDFGSQNQNRWDAITEALVGGSGVVRTEQANVVFGAALYDNSDGCPTLQSVLPMLNNLTEIDNLMDRGPGGSTPTGESIDAYVDTFDTSEGFPVLVLATDGAPDYCANPQANDPVGPDNMIDQAELEKAMQMSRDAIKRAYDMGIKSFVLGVAGNSSNDDAVSPQVFRDHLDELARIGDGQDQDTGSATAFSATNPQELAAAFSTIVGTVRSCTFDVDGMVDLARAAEGMVSLNGTPLTYQNDWQLTNQTTMELLGAACETFKSDASPTLEANFPCGTVVPLR